MSKLQRGPFKVTLPGEEYIWRPSDMTVGEQLTLESELDGMSMDDFATAVDERRAEACQVLVWWLRHLAGQPDERGNVDFKIRQLSITVHEDGELDPEASAGSEPATD